MLFVLEDDVLECLNDDTVLALQNIAECMHRGSHIILAKRSLLMALSNAEVLNDANRRIYFRRYAEMSQYGGMLSKIKSQVHVFGGRSDISVEKVEDSVFYNIPLRLLSNCENLQPTNLVCEDIMDCEFYRSLTMFCKKKYGLYGNIIFSNVNGGGKNTYKNYENKLKASFTPCLTIVDSDKIDLESELGETAKSVSEKYAQYRNKRITECCILKVREKENLIPPKVYYELEDNVEIKKDYGLLVDVYNSDHQELYLFWDIKSGHLGRKREVENYLTYEINRLMKAGIKIEDLKDQADRIKKYFGDNPICTIIDKLYGQSNNKALLHGTRHAFEHFRKDILERNLQDRIKEKKELLEHHKTKCLEEETTHLQNRWDIIISELDHITSLELCEYWEQIVTLCYEWGCCLQMYVS